MERHSVARLIGSAPGYVGYADGAAGGGMLINDVEQNNRCILLLDEVEKAHPDVFNLLLQVMDDARLTSSTGKIVDFRNVIIIMTSNAGAAQMSKSAIGFRRGDHHLVRHDNVALKKHFAPEFLNRLDGVVPFNALSIEQLNLVATKFLDDIKVNLNERGISVEIDAALAEWLVTKGYDAAMGARPIARTIDQFVRLPLADAILRDDVKEGWNIQIGMAEDNELSFQVKAPPLKRIKAK